MGAEKQRTILLVDDEAIIAMATKMALEKYGYDVITALSGEEAIATTEKTPAIDLILMDINLGAGMDGTEAATIILRQRDIPVVFLSSHMEPEVVEKTEKITSYGYVVKNSSITVLDASIKMAFKLYEAKIKEKEKGNALRESEEWNKLILSTVLSGVMVIDVDTRKIVEVNEMALKLIGLPKEQVIGFICHRFVCPAEEKNCPILELGQKVDFSEKILLTANGERKNIIKTVVAVQLQGRKYLIESFVDITEHKQAAEAIFQSKKDWEDCFDSITDMITIHDNDYNIMRTNKAGKALLKLPALEEHLQLKCFSFYHGTDAPPAGCPSCDCLKSGKPGVFEMFEPHLGRYLEIRALPRFDSKNQRVGLIHIVRDITERKQSESQREAALAVLRKSEDRYRALVENASDLVYSTDKAGRFTYVNKAALTTTGYEESELIGKLYPTLIHPDIRKKAIKLFLSQIKNGTQNTYSEFPILTKDGREIWLGQNTQLIKEDGRVTGLQAVSRDITEIKRVESQKQAALAALRESEQRYRALVETASDIVYSTDKAGHFTFMNRAALITTGYEEKELIGKQYVTLVRPDMRAKALKLFGRQFVKGIHNTYSELPIITKDGRERWIGQNIQMLMKDGRVTGFQAVSRDITERKEAEEAFLREKAFLDQLVESAPEAIVLAENNGQILRVNSEFEKMFGYSVKEAVGRLIDDLVAPPKYRREATDVTQTVAQGEKFSLETVRRRKDGALLHVSLVGSPIIIGGEQVAVYGIYRDISERKQAEEEIKRQLSEKETLLKEVHHRIKNNIASIGGLLSLHMQSITNPEAVAVLKDAGSRVDSMRLLYDKLLLTEDYEYLSVKNYLEDLIDTIIALFPDKAKVKLDRQIADFSLDAKQLFPLGIIINELLTNKIKYAFSNKDAGIIKISLTKADNHVALTIQDNGNELPAGFDINKTKGFGLTLVKMLSQQLGGSFSIKKLKGTKCKVEFDI